MRTSPFLQDFTIDGQAWDDVSDVTEDNAKQAYRDILIYVAGEFTDPGDALCMLGEFVRFLPLGESRNNSDWPIDFPQLHCM